LEGVGGGESDSAYLNSLVKNIELPKKEVSVAVSLGACVLRQRVCAHVYCGVEVCLRPPDVCVGSWTKYFKTRVRPLLSNACRILA